MALEIIRRDAWYFNAFAIETHPRLLRSAVVCDTVLFPQSLLLGRHTVMARDDNSTDVDSEDDSQVCVEVESNNTTIAAGVPWS